MPGRLRRLLQPFPGLDRMCPLRRGIGFDACFLAFFVVCAGLAAAALPPDSSWDLRNYHLYNGFAALNGKFGYDLAPAQMQTFFSPTTDMVFYVLRQALGTQPVLLNVVLSLPTALGAFLAFQIALCFLPRTGAGVLLAVLAVGIGATGAAGLPTIATAMTEMVPGCCVLGGLLILLTGADSASLPARRLVAAGALFGIAAGLKLTSVPSCVAVTVALLLVPPGSVGARVRRIVIFGAAAVLALLLAGGPWWLTLYHRYDSPLFPFFNNIFHSPFANFAALSGTGFEPHGWVQAVFYPFFWAFERSTLSCEIETRDPRFALAGLAVAATVLMLASGRGPDTLRRRRIGFFVIFVAVSYVLWVRQFSILRYLAPLELLTGVALLLPFLPLFRSAAGRIALPAVTAAGLAGLLVFTVTPDWGRAERGGGAVSVQLPALPADALVMLLDDGPMSYVAAFAPRSVRFVGANNNFVHLGQATGLDREVGQAIRSHTGPIWGLETRDNGTGQPTATLAYYGLQRAAGCRPVRSNLDRDALQICRLVPLAGRT